MKRTGYRPVGEFESNSGLVRLMVAHFCAVSFSLPVDCAKNGPAVPAKAYRTPSGGEQMNAPRAVTSQVRKPWARSRES